MTGGGIGERIEAALGQRPVRAAALSGGCIADIKRVDLANGETVVVKWGGDLATEADMLRYLAAHSDLPVPGVIHAEDDLLIMEFVETRGGMTGDAEEHAADLIADLHGVTTDQFGHARDTLIGPLAQPNPWTESWRDFFAEHRLMYMGRLAVEAGRWNATGLARLETLAGRLDRWIDEPEKASLIHGDLWGGNVLTRDGRIAAFIDPAIYYADPEIELAFSTLFGTFGDRFFARYRERRPLAPGFFEERRDLYNLYPLLVHARLFGGGYAAQVESTLTRFGV